jgi:hypothetical protein
MSADPSWRNAVERAVEERLKAIVTGETYLTTPVLVTRSIVPDIREYDTPELLGTGRPIFGVLRRSGSAFQRDGQETHGNTHAFAIVGYVKGVPQGEPAEVASERCWSAFKDAVVCLSEDPTLSGLVDDLICEEETETDEGAIEPFAWFVQPFLATAPGDPLKGA